MRKSINMALAAGAILASAGGIGVGMAGSASAGVIGAQENLVLHGTGPGWHQQGTFDISGALLHGSGTWRDEQPYDIAFQLGGCTFTATVSDVQASHGTYLVYAGNQPSNACAGLNGSGDWQAHGNTVTAEGPMVINRPHYGKPVIHRPVYHQVTSYNRPFPGFNPFPSHQLPPVYKYIKGCPPLWANFTLHGPGALHCYV
jgi:hypothetical protein